jgi:hypothetical protein
VSCSVVAVGCNGRPDRAAGGWAQRSGDRCDHAPVIHELSSPPSGEDRPARVHFVDQLAGWTRQLGELPAWSESIVQPVIIVPAEEIVGIGDVAVE